MFPKSLFHTGPNLLCDANLSTRQHPKRQQTTFKQSETVQNADYSSSILGSSYDCICTPMEVTFSQRWRYVGLVEHTPITPLF